MTSDMLALVPMLHVSHVTSLCIHIHLARQSPAIYLHLKVTPDAPCDKSALLVVSNLPSLLHTWHVCHQDSPNFPPSPPPGTYLCKQQDMIRAPQP